MQREIENPDSDWDSTGLSRKFIEHVWDRVKWCGINLNPLNWIDEDGTFIGSPPDSEIGFPFANFRVSIPISQSRLCKPGRIARPVAVAINFQIRP
jgi:hypothetical protein